MAVSNAPWGDTSASDYEDAGAFCDACLINGNDGPRSKWAKGACKLPVKQPNGDLNRNAVHAAAAVLAGGRGGVDASPADKKAAARKLIGLYGALQEDPPDSLKSLAQ